MSLEAVLARVSQLQTAMAPPAPSAQPTKVGAQFGQVLNAANANLAGLTPISATGGTVGQKMVALAQQEIGVKEQPMGSNDSPRIAEYRKATAGSGVGPWCAYFTSWLAKSAGAPVGEAGQGFGSVDALYSWAQRTGKAVDNGPGVRPNPGDLIVWDEHIGMVERVDADGTVHTIEGNSSDQVIRRTHPATGALGYVKMS
ncbi:MAG: CHAP domain-containing protein [Solirubrobacteraceae bacterium]|nr:CHAP domain-containing protein [Solirubrobacteraceae bacterium]